MPLLTVGLVLALIGETYARLGTWPRPMQWASDSPFPSPANSDPATWSWVYGSVLVGMLASMAMALGTLVRWILRQPLERASALRITFGCALLLGWVLVDPGSTWDWFQD